jgi:membrane-bound lytic murein transglycosylase B
MQNTRRGTLLGLSALVLSACSGGVGLAPQAAEPSMRAVPNAGFDAWVEGFRARAAGQGIAPATLDAGLRGVGFLPGVVERDRNQTEFSRSIEDYLSIAASDERVSKGRAALARQAGVLAAIERRYGVPSNVVAAVWGLESLYGERRGDVPVISALATLAYEGRRGAFFESQLVAALKIIQAGDVSASGMTGSWAGAMGHTQFIPTSYLAYAVDFTGDGRRDIWSADPTDALASTAAYLSRSGWVAGQPWGLEVRLPPGISTAGSRDASAWAAAGVVAADGGALPPAGSGQILTPAGASGPAFLVFRNFNAILRYNNAQSYALGVGHLSDRLLGRGGIRGSFPPDAQGLSKADRQEIQSRLTRAGFDTEGTDGVIGARTVASIEAYQQSRGLPVTGQATAALLAHLRRG